MKIETNWNQLTLKEKLSLIEQNEELILPRVVAQSKAKSMGLKKDNVIKRLSRQEVLNYEIHSHWLPRWITFSWGQNLMGTYFAWKVIKKYNRYLISLEERNRVLNKKA